MMHRNPAKPTEITLAEAKAQMMDFLYGCRLHKLNAVTVDELHRRHRVPRAVIEHELATARQVRAG